MKLSENTKDYIVLALIAGVLITFVSSLVFA